MPLSNLKLLESESIYIIREAIACSDKPVMFYSIGKDSSVMLHLARKAFYPAPLPFPLLHIDTMWKFKEMIAFRNRLAKNHQLELLVHINPDGARNKISPFTHGSVIHTNVMKTAALKQALDHYQFDMAFGGARRDEEPSRAKERIFSFRTTDQQWDPKNQRPELWSQFNTRKHPGESMRVFPLSNWTEKHIWHYIYQENIDIVPLYFSKVRPIVKRNSNLIMVDDDRMLLLMGEKIEYKKVRFRSLGCYPLTPAIESSATTLADIIYELDQTEIHERDGRLIDRDEPSSMERKKEEGYF